MTISYQGPEHGKQLKTGIDDVGDHSGSAAFLNSFVRSSIINACVYSFIHSFHTRHIISFIMAFVVMLLYSLQNCTTAKLYDELKKHPQTPVAGQLILISNGWVVFLSHLYF